MALNRRERLRETTVQEIKSVARQQMAEQGVASISLRGIAAEMGMAAPSLYNYFKNRDDLITALLVEAFNSVADSLEVACLQVPSQDSGRRLLAAYLAYRDWALAHPTDFVLINGNPIPGYHAPADITSPAAGRIMQLFRQIWREAWEQGHVTIPPEYAELPPRLRDQLAVSAQELPPEILRLLLAGWGHALGLVSLELYGQLKYSLSDATEFYQSEFIAFLKRLGMNVQ